jgi:hypothetical protein
VAVLSVGVMAGIVAGSVAVVGIVIAAIVLVLVPWCARRRAGLDGTPLKSEVLSVRHEADV